MDPDAKLATIREIQARWSEIDDDSDQVAELAELALAVQDLDEWIMGGGSLPADWRVCRMKPVAMIGGRCWEFEHSGVSYHVMSLNGSDKVSLWWRSNDTWVYRYERFTRGRSAKSVAEEIYSAVTSG